MVYRPADPSEHAQLLLLAKRSPYTKDFSNRVMFSSGDAYAKGWIWCASDPRVEPDENPVVGFACVRHKVREPVTMLYFLAVQERWRRRRVGYRLLDNIMYAGPHSVMELNVMKENDAVGFYQKLGFRIVGEGLKGQAYRMRGEWEK